MKQRRAAAITALAICSILGSTAFAGAMTSQASAATSDVTVEWTVTQDWGTGYQGTVKVSNTSTGTIAPGSLTVPYANTITSIWDANLAATTDGYRFTGPSWNTSLAPGGSASFGFIATSKGSAVKPASCTIPTGTCSVIGAAATPTPTVTPTATPTTTSTPTPTATTSPATGSPAALTVGVKVTSDWGSGRNVDLTVTNTSTSSIKSWWISLPWTGSSVSAWNGTATLSGSQLRVTNASWNGALAPGASATVGMTDNGTFTMPSTCTSSATSCAIAGSPATSTASATPTATATPSPTATTSSTSQVGTYTGSRKIIAYYPAWATYARNYQVADIPGSKVTTINYAFANIQNGRCVLGDSYADIDKAFAGDTWDQGALRGNFNQLNKLKAANPGLKTMISIGGWTWSANFSSAAATDASRKAFASSCTAFMKQYGFDGVDIDWEYPVSGGLQAGSPADKQNYTALLKEFRTQLDALGRTDAKHYDLSIAAPAGPTVIPNLEIAELGATLDWMNLMSYDFHGSWDPITGHNAPMIVGSKDMAAKFSITDAVNAYIWAGFPASKLVLGVPFYGRGWQNVSSTAGGLYQPGTAATVGTWENGVFDYTDIRANYLPKMTRYWDSEAQVPYLYDPVSKLWISYDDAQSIKVKADFIKAKGLGGAMIWEISGDRNNELLDTLVTNL